MKKAFLAFFLFCMPSLLQAQETAAPVIEESYEPSITPERRWEQEKAWRKNIDYKARNRRPEQLKEMIRASEAIRKRKAYKNIASGESDNSAFQQKSVNVDNPEDVKNYMNEAFKKDMDDTIATNNILTKERIDVQ